MKLIGKLTPSGVASTVINNIPQTYSALMIIISCRSTYTGETAFGMKMRFNTDTSADTNYSFIRVTGQTPSNGATSTGSVWKILGTGAGSLSNIYSVTSVIIPNYTGTTISKKVGTVVSNIEPGSSGMGFYDITPSAWNSTAAINSITFYDDSGMAFALGSSIYIYGI